MVKKKKKATNVCIVGKKKLVMLLAVHVLIKKPSFLRPKQQHDF